MCSPSPHLGSDHLAEVSYLTYGLRERHGQGAVASSWPATHVAGIAPSGPVGGDHPSASASTAPGTQQRIARGQPRGGRSPGGDRRAHRTAGCGARPRPPAPSSTERAGSTQVTAGRAGGNGGWPPWPAPGPAWQHVRAAAGACRRGPPHPRPRAYSSI